MGVNRRIAFCNQGCLRTDKFKLKSMNFSLIFIAALAALTPFLAHGFSCSKGQLECVVTPRQEPDGKGSWMTVLEDICTCKSPTVPQGVCSKGQLECVVTPRQEPDGKGSWMTVLEDICTCKSPTVPKVRSKDRE